MLWTFHDAYACMWESIFSLDSSSYMWSIWKIHGYCLLHVEVCIWYVCWVFWCDDSLPHHRIHHYRFHGLLSLLNSVCYWFDDPSVYPKDKLMRNLRKVASDLGQSSFFLVRITRDLGVLARIILSIMFDTTIWNPWHWYPTSTKLADSAILKSSIWCPQEC